VKARKRLYPTVKEQREIKDLKNKLGFVRTATSKSSCMPLPKSLEKVRTKEHPRRD